MQGAETEDQRPLRRLRTETVIERDASKVSENDVLDRRLTLLIGRNHHHTESGDKYMKSIGLHIAQKRFKLFHRNPPQLLNNNW